MAAVLDSSSLYYCMTQLNAWNTTMVSAQNEQEISETTIVSSNFNEQVGRMESI